MCEEVSADLRFQCPILRHVSALEVLCQAVAQPILRCRNFQATTLHSDTRQRNFSNKIHLVNGKLILSKKFHPVGFADMMQVKPTILATFVPHLFRRLACDGTTYKFDVLPPPFRKQHLTSESQLEPLSHMGHE